MVKILDTLIAISVVLIVTFEAYGGAFCKCCNEDIKDFLIFDHIDGGGSVHRKQIKGKKMPVWLKQQGYPPGFQVLCQNCNWGKYINNGICPHKERSWRKVSP